MWLPIGLGGRDKLERADVYASLVLVRKHQHALRSKANNLVRGLEFSEVDDKLRKIRAEADIRALYECCEHQARILESILKRMDEMKKSFFISEEAASSDLENLTGSVLVDKTYYYY